MYGSTNYSAANTGWAGEESLDLDMASAVCPNCHIILVAGMYALAGNGATINNGSYPYLNPGHPNDITSGDDITGDPSGPVSCPVG
ncbi:MAG: hypothetical protein ACYC8W_11400 [Candidatus Tyrphobacter sp.]